MMAGSMLEAEHHDVIAPCLATATGAGMLGARLPAVHDVDAPALPTSLPPVVDAHVHLFPDRLFEALWRWFDTHGWQVRYPLRSPEVVSFLLDRGVRKIVALHYAHREGMARSLNRYVATLAAVDARIVGTATVFPGEEGSAEILAEAFAQGLRGVKMHCHVQCFAPDESRVEDVYRACVEAGVPLVMHAGREPKSPAYDCDPHLICSADRVEAVLRSYPTLKLVVPHLGADEFDAYGELLDRYDNLWLDTTMAVTGFLPGDQGTPLVLRRPDRVLYGTDFPNIPYAWDREVRALARSGLREEELAAVLGDNARTLWGS
jgi:hypothetical protein